MSAHHSQFNRLAQRRALQAGQDALQRMNARHATANKADAYQAYQRRAADLADLKAVEAAVVTALQRRDLDDAVNKVEDEIRSVVRSAATPQDAEQGVARILAALSVKNILRGRRS